MTTEQQITYLIDNFKSKQNKSSKWYKSDVADFVSNLKKCSNGRVAEMYSNAMAMNSKSFEAQVAKEESKMDRYGLYDVTKMKAVNALD